MAVEVWESKEVKDMAIELARAIPDHSYLLPLMADDKIKFFFVEKGSFDGKVRKIAGSVAEATMGCVFIIEINYESWKEAGDSQKYALVDTQLCRCGVEHNQQDGSIKYSLEKPDVEAFSSVVGRWGAFDESIELLIKLYKESNEAKTRQAIKEAGQVNMASQSELSNLSVDSQ